MHRIVRCAKGLYMALGMFCAIPLPSHLLDDDCMDLMLPCLPLVGAVIGAIWYWAVRLLVFTGIHSVLTAALAAVLPFVLSGFLHLDGYMDTSDALLSRRPLEEKIRILKDPHMGVFSGVMLAVLFLLQFAATYAIVDRGAPLAALMAIPVMSRCGASLALLCLKTMPQSGYGAMFRQNTRTAHKVWIAAVALVALSLSWLCMGAYGLIAAIAVAAGFGLAMLCAYMACEGVSGDLAGFSIVLGEVCGLIAMGVL